MIDLFQSRDQKTHVSKTLPVAALLSMSSLEHVACKVWTLWFPFDESGGMWLSDVR